MRGTYPPSRQDPFHHPVKVPIPHPLYLYLYIYILPLFTVTSHHYASMYPNLIPNFNPSFLNFKSSPVSRTPPKNPIQKNNPIPESEKTGMMGHKHLHELLEEDQEPFLLKNYIFDRRSQLNKPIPKTKLQPKKFRPRVEISNPKRSLWKQACFASLHQSPEVRKSPWPATAKLKSHCNCKRLNTDLLLEAARRITQNQSTVSKPKTQIKNGGFGLFGSVLKRLRGKNRPRNRELGGKSGFEKSDFQMGFGCDCNNSRRDSCSVWSEKSEGKSRGVETCRRWEEIIIGSGFEERENEGDSPFRFSLRKSTSSNPRKTDFSSPATSPVRCDKQEKCGTEGTPKIQLEEEKEQKEQCSPVSVLDPPFEDDEDGREDGDDADGCDLECSYAIVQRAKQKLLEKLLRFEKLAELDPIELEKRMLEDQEDAADDDDHEVGSSLDQLNSEKNVDRFVREVLIRQNKDSGDMRRLVIDLIAEETREEEEEERGINDRETVVKRVCERLDSWKEVESNTIDMMVELDFRRQVDGWKRIDREQVVEIAVEIEIFIFGLLEEELYQN